MKKIIDPSLYYYLNKDKEKSIESYKSARLFQKGRKTKFSKNRIENITSLEKLFIIRGKDYTEGYLSKLGEFWDFPIHTGDLIYSLIKFYNKKKREKVVYEAAINIWNKNFKK